MTNDLRDRFIVDEVDATQNVQLLIEKALKFGRVSSAGDIIIDKIGLSQDNKLKLALVLRFLAHSLDEGISATLRPVELTRVTGERVESIGSRLSRFAKLGFAKKSGYGQYVVQHYKIDKFLDELDVTNSGESVTSHVGKKSGRGVSSSRKYRLSSGIGVDIQGLVEEGFFKTPKFVSEVQKRLEEEVRYHDIRTIDTAIRKTFVGSRKDLKRISNTGNGKAKWKYVVR